ncbi:hypothetical protein BTVI_27371 [Pitangus sulphuratus]|nr:hypothetical protein BTVI_27371 [Pitangus sulphuratus]
MDIHSGAEIHWQPLKDPTPEQPDVSKEGCDPVESLCWIRFFARTCRPMERGAHIGTMDKSMAYEVSNPVKDPMQKQVDITGTASGGKSTLKQIYPKGHGRTQSGTGKSVKKKEQQRGTVTN